MFRHTHKIAPTGVLLVLSSCTSQPTAPVRVTAEALPETAACISSLAGRSDGALPALDSSGIEVVNWNIQKGRNTEWVGDLAAQNMGPDLLILQEASRKTVVWQDLVPHHHSSFAEGFGPDWSPSGVMTVSAAAPLTECELVAHEPWFGTRKATLITEYALSGTEQTLLVVNIHGINFALGISDLENQFAQARAVIEEHTGPVVFSGDFNTWRRQRAEALEQMLGSLGLTALDFDVPAPNPEPPTVRVIGVIENQAPTRAETRVLPIEKGVLQLDSRQDVAHLALVERHKGTGKVVNGFVSGFGFDQPCAIASTISHDSHHMVVVGTSKSNMAQAANRLAEIGGGVIVVREGQEIALVELPIAGLMSDERAEVVADKAAHMVQAFHECGCQLNNAFMQLSLLSLVVIPELRISDLGIVDVTKFEIVPVTVS